MISFHRYYAVAVCLFVCCQCFKPLQLQRSLWPPLALLQQTPSASVPFRHRVMTTFDGNNAMLPTGIILVSCITDIPVYPDAFGMRAVRFACLVESYRPIISSLPQVQPMNTKGWQQLLLASRQEAAADTQQQLQQQQSTEQRTSCGNTTSSCGNTTEPQQPFIPVQ